VTPSAAREAFWPTEAQEELLRAALIRGPAAITAWQAWKARNNFVGSHHDLGSFRLLPLVYKNLVALGAEDPLMPRLKGVYRFSWCANQRLFHDAAVLVQQLQEAGIRTLVLKGAALSVLHYQDRGVRPMSDVDVLVPVSQAAKAMEGLGEIGWRTGRFVEEDFSYRHAAQLTNEGGREFDLHWHAFYECLREGADDDLWCRAVPLALLHVRTLALDPSDALLHTVVHGMRWDEVPTIRWIPDAMTILRSAGVRVDWDRVVEQAARRRLLLRFGRGLCYLRERFDATVPDDVVARLRAHRPSHVERMEYHYLGLGVEEQARVTFGYYPFLMVDYLRFATGRSPLRQVLGFPGYLSYRFGLDSRSQLLGLVLRHALRKARKVAGTKSTAGARG
jgi:putative nucleotidyltransferase-like protein